jgi:hypothetical protein
VVSFRSIHFNHDAISFVRQWVSAFMKSLILNRSSSSPPPSQFFLNMKLVSFNGTSDYTRTVEIVIDQRKARGDLPLIHIKPRFVEGYIIPSQFSFQTSSGANINSR